MARAKHLAVVPNEPAKPHEPKPEEAAAIARYRKRHSDAPPLPTFTMKMEADRKTGQPVAKIAVDYPEPEDGYRIIGDALSSGDGAFVAGIIRDLSGSGVKNGEPDLERLNFALSIVKGIKPRNELESTLATQMAAIHIATMHMSAVVANCKTVPTLEVAERSLNRLARTFAAQVDTLKRLRSKGEQRVYVERVNVHRGGQAVVGNVGRGGAGEDE